MGKVRGATERWAVKSSLKTRRRAEQHTIGLAAQVIGDPSYSCPRIELLRRANALPNGARLIYEASRCRDAEPSPAEVDRCWRKLEGLVKNAEA